jgi:hypothetical protein
VYVSAALPDPALAGVYYGEGPEER